MKYQGNKSANQQMSNRNEQIGFQKEGEEKEKTQMANNLVKSVEDQGSGMALPRNLQQNKELWNVRTKQGREGNSGSDS